MKKEINISLMKQEGNELFAFSDTHLRDAGNKSKVVGSGNLTSLSEFHNELFNLSQTTFKDQEISFIVNNEVYANTTEDGLEVNPELSKGFIEKFAHKNLLEFEFEKTMIGMFKLKIKDDINLYKLEDERYIRDQNGYTDYATKEDALNSLDNFFKNDERQNHYFIKPQDFTQIKVDGELVNEYREKKSTMFPERDNQPSLKKSNGLKMK